MSENNEMEKNVRPKREEHNHLEVFGGIFPSRLEAEEFFITRAFPGAFCENCTFEKSLRGV